MSRPMLLSDWLPASIAPLRSGWYQVRLFIRHANDYARPGLRYWTGARWTETDRPGSAGVVITPQDQWRGRADPHSQGA